MKTINYTGPSKLISRIVYLLNRKAPLPLDGDGDPSWGTNGQVLTTDGTGATYWSAGGGSGDVTDVKVNGTSVVDANKVANVSVPTKVSDLTNDTGFITNTVNNLTNYYLSSNTYTKTEVDSLISAIMTLNILVVQSLPVSDISTTTIYLVPKSTPDTQDVYDEYINLDGTSSGWEHIGSTQIDLSNYYTKTEINALLSAKANTADLATVATSGSYTDLSNIPTIPAAQVQSDWTQSDSSAVDFIKNKPTIPSSSGHTIWNRIKTALTSRAALWFADASVSDASAVGATKVEVVTELQSESAFDNLATDGSADGVYVFPDSGDEYLDAYVVGYKNGSVGDALDDINDELTPTTGPFAAGNTSYISNVRKIEYVKVGKVVNFNIFFDLGASPSNGSVLFTINDPTLFPKIDSVVPLVGTYNNTAFKVNLNPNGNIELNSTQTISAGSFYAISGTYICV